MDKYTKYIKEKENSEKLSITLKSNRDDLYSGWEINNITSTINNTYYKGELLNTIESLLNNGTNPKNIYVLSESFSIKQLYRNLEKGIIDITEDNGVASLYHLGYPTSLYPNKNVLLLAKIFQLYSNLYTYANNNNLEFPKKDPFLKYIFFKIFIDDEDFDLREILRKELKELNVYRLVLEDSKSSKLKDNDSHEEIDKVFNFLKNDLAEYDNLRKLILSQEIIDENTLKEKNTFEKYFSFSNTFNKLERPIVCVYEENNKKIRVLCHDFIVRSQHNEQNYRFLKTRNISQNSPLVIDLMLGVGYGSYLINFIERMILLYKAEKQKLQSNMNSGTSDRIEELDRKIADLEEKRNNQDLLEEIKKIEKTKSDTTLGSNQEMSEVSAGLVSLETQKINKKINSDIRQTLKTEKIKIHVLKYKE